MGWAGKAIPDVPLVWVTVFSKEAATSLSQCVEKDADPVHSAGTQSIQTLLKGLLGVLRRSKSRVQLFSY